MRPLPHLLTLPLLLCLLLLAPALRAAQGLEAVWLKEKALDGRPALALLFSRPLDTSRAYDPYLSVRVGGVAAEGGWVAGSNPRLLLFPGVVPEAEYEVSVAAGLPAADGTVSSAAQSLKLTTRAVAAAAAFASRGSVLPAGISDGLPVMTVNVPEVNIEFLRVRADRLPRFIADYYWQGRTSNWELERMHPFTESVFSGRFATPGAPNQRVTSHIPVQEIEALAAPGLYIAVLSKPGHFTSSHPTSFFFVSDIGLHARLYAGGMDVYANSLRGGTPLPDTTLTLYDAKGREVERVQTDATGRAHLEGEVRADQLLVAERAGHLALLPLRDAALDISEFDVGGRPFRPVELFVWGPRDLYRPGERATFSVLMRGHDGEPLAPRPLAARLLRPDGKVARRFVMQPGELGYFQQTLELDRDAQTGRWSLELRADPANKQPDGQFAFHVEEFLPERMKLLLASDQLRLLPGEPLRVAVEGSYLYGAPAAENRLAPVVRIGAAPHPLEGVAGFKGFRFGDEEEQLGARSELAAVKLDAAGRHTLEIAPFKQPARSPARVTVTASLFERGGRPVTRSFSRLYWPAETLVGVRPLFEEYAPGAGPAEFEVVRATADGALHAGELEVTLVREERDHYWVYEEGGGWHVESSDSHYPVLEETLKVGAEGPVRLSLPVESGSYRLEIRDPQSGLLNRHRFHVGWGWAEEGGADNRPDKVVLKLDRPAYAPGDVARVTVTPPHAGEALLLLESDRLLWSQRLYLPAEGREVEIPVAAEWKRHDIYLTAVVLRPGDGRARVTPNRALGVVHLPLERTARHVTPTLTVAETIRPEGPLTVEVSAPELAGRAARVVVAAVDVGVLAISGYGVPDPAQLFFARGRYAVEGRDIYGKVIEAQEGQRARLRFGGDADRGSGSKRPDSQVRIVSLYSGAVALDAEGRARVELAVPDFNGRLRVAALLFSEESFGSATTEVTVVAPLVAELAAPRFLAGGDRSVVTLDLDNRSGAAQTLEVEVSGDGPLWVENGRQLVELADGGRTSLRFPLAARGSSGSGVIRVGVRGEGIDLVREQRLGVRPPFPGEVRSARHLVDAGGELALPEGLAAGLLAEGTTAQLSLSPTPPLAVREQLKALFAYPYGCLEQTVSRAWPLLYLDSAEAGRWGLKPLDEGQRLKRIGHAINRVAGMQLASGGFSLWGSGDEEPWLSPYATEFLIEAHERGFEVAEEVLRHALENLEQRLQGASWYYTNRYSNVPDHFEFAARAYAGFVLSRLHRAPLGTLRNLYDNQRAKARSGLPLIHLGLALAAQGDQRRAAAALEEGVAKLRDEGLYLGDYGSRVRDTALAVALTAGQGLAAGDRLVFQLGDELHRTRWFSTQERFALYRAARALGGAGTAAWSATLVKGGVSEKLEGRGELRVALTPEQLAQGVSIHSATDRPLYALVRVEGYPEHAPLPVEEPVRVERTLYTLAGKPAGDGPLASGDLLLVHLKVTSREALVDALVEDLLPAGLEAENLNLTQGETLEGLVIDGVDPAAAMEKRAIRHLEYRDDRFTAALHVSAQGTTHLFYLARVVSPGVFNVPPPRVEDMYRPQIRAIGRSGPALVVEEARPPAGG